MTVFALTAVILCSSAILSALETENNACTKLLAYPIAAISKNCYYNPDVLSDTISMAARHGYKVETYTVTTEDKYILNVFRILPSKSAKRKIPIFIQHGIVTNSGVWVDVGNRSLAFNLADLGYDVWLGNVRGTTYSNQHLVYTVNDPDYWNFCLDTVARVDISVQLNLVSNNTGHKGDIVYIGHSMGTTLGFMYASAYAEEAGQLLQGIIMMAPVVYLNGVPTIEAVKPLALTLIKLLISINIKGLFYQEDIIHKALTDICKLVPIICKFAIEATAGYTNQFAARDLLLFYSYWPTGVSLYQLLQYLQIAGSAKFQKFDYGEEDNLEIYGDPSPPLYDLSDVKLPVHLFYGLRDSLYREENLDRVYEELGSTAKFKHETPANNATYNFDHVDFMYSEYIQEFLYGELFDVINTQFANVSVS